MKLFSTIGSIAILVSFGISAQVSFQPSGKTLTLGGNSYYVPPSPVSQFRLDEEIEWPINSATKAVTGKLIPFSVVSTSDPVFTEDTFEATLQAWAAKDDVWNVSFLTGMMLAAFVILRDLRGVRTGVYILFNGSHSSPDVSLSSVQKKYAIDLLLLSESYPTGFSLTKPLPSGPYFLEHSTGNIFEGSFVNIHLIFSFTHETNAHAYVDNWQRTVFITTRTRRSCTGLYLMDQVGMKFSQSRSRVLPQRPSVFPRVFTSPLRPKSPLQVCALP